MMPFFHTILGTYGSDGNNSLWTAVFILILFVLVMVAAFVTTKLFGKMGTHVHRNRNMKIIEAIHVGQGKSIQLIQVGERYLVIGVGKDHITHLTELQSEDIQLKMPSEDQTLVPFGSYLNQLMHKKNQKNLRNRGEEDETDR